MPTPAVFRSLLLPEHHGPCYVLPCEQPREEQPPEVGRGERWACKPQHQPVHSPDTPGRAGSLRLLPGSPHMPREALAHHQRLPQPHFGPLCLCPAPSPRGASPDAQPCVLIMLHGSREQPAFAWLWFRAPRLEEGFSASMYINSGTWWCNKRLLW